MEACLLRTQTRRLLVGDLIHGEMYRIMIVIVSKFLGVVCLMSSVVDYWLSA